MSFDQIEISAATLPSGSELDLDLIGTDTANLNYLFPNGFTVGSGGDLVVGAGVRVQIPEGETLTDDGTLSFASGDTLTLGSACCSAAEIVVAGTLTAAGTTFTGISESGTIVVNSGGIITPTGSTFNVPLIVPYNDVASLAAGTNVSFDQIEISAATLPSGSELDLDLIGTDTANLNYLFPNGFTVGSGGDLVVGAGVRVQIPEGETLTDDGTLSFASGDTLTLGSACCSAAEIVVAGTLTAAGTTFTGISESGTIVVNSGGIITPTGSTFNVPLFVPYNDVASLAAGDNVSFDQIEISAATLPSGSELDLDLIGTDTANLNYLFPNGFTVGSGGDLVVGAGVPVQIPEGETLTDDGTLSFASGDTLTLGSACCSAAEIVVAGTLTAAGTTFTGISESGTIVVNSGGIITPTGSTFNVPLYVPYNDVASLAAGNNVSFDQIEISAATLPSGNELDLDLIGTDTANLNYLFPNGFTVGSGGDLVVGAGVRVQIPEGETLTDDGTLSFASGDTLTLGSACCSAAEIVVAGTLTAAGTTFTGISESGTIVVNSGGELNATSTTFSVNQVVVESGSTANLQFAAFATQLAIDSGASINIHNDDLSSANATVVASGSSTATIDLTNNFWGTLNTTQIAAKITDHTKNSSLPTVLYQPFLTEDATGNTASNATATYSTAPQSATLSATVISADGPVNGGTETFTILSGSNVIGTPVTSNVVSGAASDVYTIPAGTPGGVYTIQAVFSGTSTLSGSSDSTHTLTISEAATTTAATSATTTFSESNQTISLSATVASSAGTVNEGTETFTILSGTTPVGSAATADVSDGAVTASYTMPGSTTGGIYTIEAVYNGTVDYGTSTDTSQSLTIDPAATTSATASASATFSPVEQNVSLSTTVTSTAGTVNEGTETFTILLGSTVIGSPVTVNVVAGAAGASYGIPGGTPPGTYTIQAVYSGTINFLGYTDNGQVLVINAPALTDFWTGASAAEGGNDNWSNPGNWALGAPPTAAETAYFTASESQYSTSIVDTSFSIANLTIDSTWGGTVGASGSLTVSGNLILASGTLGGNGAISVAGSGSQFTGGTLSGGNVTNSGTLTVSGSGSETLSGTLTNTGTIDVTGTGTFAVTGTIDGGTVDAGTGTNLALGGSTLDGVTVDGNFTVSGDSSLTVQDGLTLNGTLSLGDSSSIGYLDFTGSQTLGGAGTVVFGSATYRTPYYGYTYYNGLFVTTAGDTLTIGPSVAVSGSLGYIGYASYEGSSGGSVVNQGTIEWANGASISIPGTLTNDGTITVDATSTMSPGGTIVGGTITTQTGAGVANVTLDGVTVDGNWEVVSENSVSVLDGLTINGTLTLGDSSTIGYLNFSGSQTLGGTGTVVFGSATYRNPYYGYVYYNGLFVTTAGDTLTIGPGVTVQGAVGYIGYASYEGSAGGSIVNEGTIQADVSGGTITIDETGGQNTGSLNALNGATLSLQGSNWQDSGVNYADATSAFSVAASFSNSGNTLALTGPGTFTSSGTIQGGTISVAVGTLLSDSGTLDGVTVNGNWEVVSDNSVSVLDGLTINGTLTLGDSSTIGYLNFSGSQTLGGTGTVVFGSATYRNPYYGYVYYNGLFVTTAGDTLTIGPSVAVSGSLGYIGYASYEGSSGGSVVNQGTIEWANGASISIPGTLTNDGTITVDATSTMSPGGTIVGGTITTQTGAGVGNVTLDGVTVDGNWEVVSENSVSVLDGLTINGTLTLGDSSTIGYLDFSGSQTLGGTGTVVFGSATYRNPYYGYVYYNGLFVTTAGDTLTIGPGVTVQGAVGYIGYASYEGSAGGSIVNEGTIQADVSGETITIDETGGQNTGSLNALNGATLSLQGSNWQDSGVNYADATSAFSLAASFSNSGNTLALTGPGTFTSSGTIQGGTISVAVGTLLSDSGTLDGVTVDGNWEVVSDNSVSVLDGLTINGTLTLGDSSTIGYLNFSGSQTLGGTGAVVFGSATYRNPYYGYVYYNGLFVTTAGDTLTIGASVAVSGSLGYIGYASYEGSSGGSVVNQGTIEWANGASISIPGTLTNDGTITVDATSTMSPGGTIVGGTITTQTGAGVANVTLDGVTVDGNWEVVSENSVSVLDGLTINGTLTLGDSSTIGYLNFSGSQTLGGTGTVVFGSATYRNPYYGYVYYNGLFVATAGDTLTIGPGVTVQGAVGYIGYASYEGSAGGSIVNEGTIQADVSGETITIDETGGQNTGSLNALNGATLSSQGSNWQDSGVNYADATSAFSLAASFSNSGNTLALTGPGTFTSSGTIQGGTISVAVGTLLSDSGTLDGVTVDGNWEVVSDNSVSVLDGLTINGTLTLGDSSTIGYLNFSGSQTLGGTGTVVFGSATYRNPYYGYVYYNGLFVTTAGDTLTIGPSVAVSGSLGYIGYASYEGSAGGSIVNEGTIQADVSGASIAINGTGGAFLNSGTVNASAGAISISTGSYGTVNSGTLAAGPTGTLYITGPFTQTATGNFNEVLGGSTTGLYGQTSIGGTASLDGTLNVSEAEWLFTQHGQRLHVPDLYVGNRAVRQLHRARTQRLGGTRARVQRDERHAHHRDRHDHRAGPARDQSLH